MVVGSVVNTSSPSTVSVPVPLLKSIISCFLIITELGVNDETKFFGVGDIATELGIDHEYVLSRLKYLADNSDDENISLQSIKELGKAVGTLGGVTKKVETGVIGMFQGFDPKQIESAKRNLLTDKKEVSDA